jgi:endonuclease G
MRRGWIALLLIAACAHAPAPKERPRPESPRSRSRATFAAVLAFDHDARRRLDQLCPLGRPRWIAGVPSGTDLIVRRAYALEHSAQDKVPFWVCERLRDADLVKNTERGDRFGPDPLLDPTRRAELGDYKGSGFSRGHLAASANHLASQEDNRETFFLSNVAPQLQALNGGLWARIEARVRSWVTAQTSIWIVSGAMFHHLEEEDPATADGWVERAEIGAGKVAVPTHFYKIVAFHEAGRWRTVAFVVEHRPYPKGTALDETITTVDWIEARTGLDFLPQLSAEDAAAIESARATIP